ncbi:hypothetical protein Sxan_02200 [Streptomyces xanthophaeus]|uniref:Uncharacterized protein n=1 Tax=Streptomyces xanthophaeus TaxID=67385 RepID=A0A919GUH1_9ACTN|nr:hypothetical protein Sxan_02200 [Streptomyces xanthophaeus]
MEPRRARDEKAGGRTLDLKRETLRDLDDPLLSSQGWTLWCCDDTALPPGATTRPTGSKPSE